MKFFYPFSATISDDDASLANDYCEEMASCCDGGQENEVYGDCVAEFNFYADTLGISPGELIDED